MTRECCEGCKFYKTKIINEATGKQIQEDLNGCSNPFIDSSWCLEPHRKTIKGIYYEK